MDFASALDLIIDDLQGLSHALNLEEKHEVQHLAVAYLLSNRGSIEVFLKEVYEKVTQAERLELCKTHQELSEIAAHDEFYERVKFTFRSAENHWKAISSDMRDHDRGNTWDQLVHVTKGLRFARYCRTIHGDVELFLHPINRFLNISHMP